MDQQDQSDDMFRQLSSAMSLPDAEIEEIKSKLEGEGFGCWSDLTSADISVLKEIRKDLGLNGKSFCDLTTYIIQETRPIAVATAAQTFRGQESSDLGGVPIATSLSIGAQQVQSFETSFNDDDEVASSLSSVSDFPEGDDDGGGGRGGFGGRGRRGAAAAEDDDDDYYMYSSPSHPPRRDGHSTKGGDSSKRSTKQDDMVMIRVISRPLWHPSKHPPALTHSRLTRSRAPTFLTNRNLAAHPPATFSCSRTPTSACSWCSRI
jgi:hypothetical protein